VDFGDRMSIIALQKFVMFYNKFHSRLMMYVKCKIYPFLHVPRGEEVLIVVIQLIVFITIYVKVVVLESSLLTKVLFFNFMK
jgi:hypothetical protein